MIRNILSITSALFFGTTALFSQTNSAPESSPSEAGTQILAILKAQQTAWNRGDIEAFMNGYARLESITFVSGDDVTHGWQTVYDRYQKKYPDRAAMGTLTFSDLETPLMGPDSAVVLGRWKLDRKTDQPHGRFTLIFRRTTDGWRIVYDHTSAAERSK